MNVLAYLVLLQNAVSPFHYIPEDVTAGYSYSPQNSMVKSIARIEDIPHHVVIAYGGFFCSGTLVRSLIVLTTASCFAKRLKQKVYVKVGANTTTGFGQVIPVVEIKLHEYYKHASAVNNDIALAVLEADVTFGSSVKKVLLIEADVAIRVGTAIEVSGWGYSNLPSKFTNHLLWSEMVVVSKAECKGYYGGLITSSSYCAKYQADRRLSDNGGPAMYRGLLVGLLSFGANYREEPHVAVFTNVSYFHRWITLNCKRFLEKYCTEPVFDDYYYSDANER